MMVCMYFSLCVCRNAASSISSELANRIKLPPHSGNDETVIGEKMDKGAGDDKESVNAQKDLEAENRSDMMEVEESEPFIPSSSVRPVENCNKTSPTPSSSAGGGATPAANQKVRNVCLYLSMSKTTLCFIFTNNEFLQLIHSSDVKVK